MSVPRTYRCLRFLDTHGCRWFFFHVATDGAIFRMDVRPSLCVSLRLHTPRSTPLISAPAPRLSRFWLSCGSLCIKVYRAGTSVVPLRTANRITQSVRDLTLLIPYSLGSNYPSLACKPGNVDPRFLQVVATFSLKGLPPNVFLSFYGTPHSPSFVSPSTIDLGFLPCDVVDINPTLLVGLASVTEVLFLRTTDRSADLGDGASRQMIACLNEFLPLGLAPMGIEELETRLSSAELLPSVRCW